MSLYSQFKDHFLIGGHGALAGWGLLVLLIASSGLSGGRLKDGVDFGVFVSILIAAALTGNGVYALNAYHDREVDRINKPSRPIPSGRMTPEHAFKYAVSLMVLGWFGSLAVSMFTGRYLVLALWSVFTLLGIVYSTPPLKLKAHHIFGNLCFAAFAALTFTISNVAFGIPILNITIYVATLAVLTILGVGLITIKDFHDYEGDKAKGDITFPVKVGKVRAAAISIALMVVFIVFLALFYPERLSNFSLFFQWYWYFLIFPVSFGVYIVLECFLGSKISNAYSGMQYYLVIFLVGYLFLRDPLGFLGGLPSPVPYSEIAIVLFLYTLSACMAIYMALRKGITTKPK
jgi:4-hydroxybenzoate polyprenyltransferase